MRKSHFFIFGHFWAKIGPNFKIFDLLRTAFSIILSIYLVFNFLCNFIHQIQLVLILWSKIEDFRSDFASKFTIGKYKGPEVQTAIVSRPCEIFKFRKKRSLRSDEIFDIRKTCKNDPGPPYRFNARGEQ